MVIACFAPGLWPLAGGYGSVLSNSQSAGYALPAEPLPWEQLYDPLADFSPPPLRDATLAAPLDLEDPRYFPWPSPVDPVPEPGMFRYWIAPTTAPSARPYPATGLLLRAENLAALNTTLTITSMDGIVFDPPIELHPILERRYELDAGQRTQNETPGWHLAARWEQAHVLSAWHEEHPHLDAMGLAGGPHRYKVTYRPVSGIADAGPPQDVGGIPGWITPGLVGFLSLLAYSLMAWCLARPEESVPLLKRLMGCWWGWLGGWVIAIVGLPLYGLGFLPGALVTCYIWERQGLGSLTPVRVAGVLAFLLVWSALCWPLFATEGHCFRS
jgi:hypothetical protein